MTFRCGDHVLHKPSGETWVVAYCAFMWKHGWPTISKPFRPDLPPDFFDNLEKLMRAGCGSDDAGNIRSSFG